MAQEQELWDAIELAFNHDAEVIAEEAVEGFEVGCAVLGMDDLTVGRVDDLASLPTAVTLIL